MQQNESAKNIIFSPHLFLPVSAVVSYLWNLKRVEKKKKKRKEETIVPSFISICILTRDGHHLATTKRACYHRRR